MGTNSPETRMVRYSPRMDPERAPSLYPLPSFSPTSVSPDGNPSVSDWLAEMRAMRKEARDERKEQTKAFVEALEGLGTKLDGSTAQIREELKRHLMVLSLVFVGSFVVLAALAGASVYLKLGPVQGGSGQSAPAAATAPVEAHPENYPTP